MPPRAMWWRRMREIQRLFLGSGGLSALLAHRNRGRAAHHDRQATQHHDSLLVVSINDDQAITVEGTRWQTLPSP